MFPVKTFGRNIRKAFLEPGFAVVALIKRLKAALSYKFSKSGKAPLPESLTFFLTYECNLRCRMCGQWGDAGANKLFEPVKVNKSLKIASYIKLLEEVKGFKPHITLFGGEPLLYSGFEELVNEIKKRGLHLGIITNGTLLKKYAKIIVNAGVEVVSISVDGPAELHDKVRGMEGAYLKLKEGVEEINRLKKEKNTAKPLLNLVCTISELNYQSIKEMPPVAGELGADTLNLHHLIFTGSETLESHNKYFKEKFGVDSEEWAGFIRPAVKEIDPKQLAKDIEELKRGKYPFLFTVYPDLSGKEIIKYYTEENFVAKEYPGRCLSPWLTAYIYPDGEVMPCQGLGFTAGNIEVDTFGDIWNGEKMQKFRKELKKQKVFKICYKCTELYRY